MRLDIPFVGPAYQARSVDVSCQRAVNCFVEVGPGDAAALYGTPGTVLWKEGTSAPVRNMIVAGDSLWVVAGAFVFRIRADGHADAVGTLQTDAGRVDMAYNILQLIIVDGSAGYLVDFITSTVVPIDDPDFPNGVTQAVFLDNFFIVGGDGSGRFYINESPNAGEAWNGADFATAEGSTDEVLTLLVAQRELHILGVDSSEVWVNTGNALFPFERANVAFIEQGVAGRWAAAKMDNTIYWLGADRNGQGIVYRSAGYAPERISTHAIEYAIGKAAMLADSFALSYSQDGHSFFVLTIPSIAATFVFDAATGTWHERATYDEKTGEFSPWNAAHHAYFMGKHLVSDLRLSRLYELRTDVYTDDGAAIKRLRVTPAINTTQLRLFFSELRVRMEAGSDTFSPPAAQDGPMSEQAKSAQVFLRWSDDGGHTWGNSIPATLGNIGRYEETPVWRRLGSGRNRVWELSMVDPVRFVVLSATAQGDTGIS